jgi:plasmid rolling circle replication initiator protein Rep
MLTIKDGGAFSRKDIIVTWCDKLLDFIKNNICLNQKMCNNWKYCALDIA